MNQALLDRLAAARGAPDWTVGVVVRRQKKPPKKQRKKAAQEALRAEVALQSKASRFDDAQIRRMKKTLCKAPICAEADLDLFHLIAASGRSDKIGLLRHMADRRYSRVSEVEIRRVRGEFGRMYTELLLMPCWCCGDKELPKDRHHVVQVQHGGTNDRANVVPLCLVCHALVHPWLQADEAYRPVPSVEPAAVQRGAARRGKQERKRRKGDQEAKVASSVQNRLTAVVGSY